LCLFEILNLIMQQRVRPRHPEIERVMQEQVFQSLLTGTEGSSAASKFGEGAHNRDLPSARRAMRASGHFNR
jgi:hypothetical protein